MSELSNMGERDRRTINDVTTLRSPLREQKKVSFGRDDEAFVQLFSFYQNRKSHKVERKASIKLK